MNGKWSETESEGRDGHCHFEYDYWSSTTKKSLVSVRIFLSSFFPGRLDAIDLQGKYEPAIKGPYKLFF